MNTMTETFVQLLWLLAIDAIFLAVLALLLVPLALYRRAAFAVLKRNFVGYFSNPTGYVFLCIFVLCTSYFAFWLPEFFNNNLANLDQLNRAIPFIMLFFVPTISMGIWAEEKRQGTDELLLTLPADDFDIVIGKYLAAAGVFTASLLFSQFSNYIVLVSLTAGDVDTGLFFANYFGYWLIGLAMLAIGMIPSFLTSNLPISFILGVLFNVPLVGAAVVDMIVPFPTIADTIQSWSIGSQFEPFGRGVLSVASLVYFLMVIAIALYVCMVLIGRRHWLGGRDGESLIWHYMFRIVAMVVVVVSLTIVFSQHVRTRPDLTRGKTASLSPTTLTLVRNLDSKYPIYVHAFISRDIPTEYAKVKRDLISLLKEFQSQGKIQVKIYNNIDTFSDEARLAEERFNIRPQRVQFRSGGRIIDDEIILGAAFTCGLQRVVVPFFDYGVSVEYELVRSINTVAKEKRRRLGIVQTDAQLNGGFSFAGGAPQQIPRQAIVDELNKQYEVDTVDPTEPIDRDKFDVLLAVQPSSMPPEGMKNLIDAIKAGVPTAIFEDPAPVLMGFVPGTGQPKQSPGGQFGGGQPMPKSNIQELWDVLGIQSPGGFDPGAMRGAGPLFQPDIAWQNYNPYEKLQLDAFSDDQWVFLRNESPGGANSINQSEDITSGLEEVLAPFPGTIEPRSDSELKFTKLLQTGEKAGTVTFSDFMTYQRNPLMLRSKQKETGRQTIAARIQGPAIEEDGEERPGLDVVYVADIDVMGSPFVNIRARPDAGEVRWNFENVTFILNVIDELSGDDAYVAIRRHKPQHSTLRLVEYHVQEAREREYDERLKFQAEHQKNVDQAKEEMDKAVKKFQDRVEDLKKKRDAGEGFNQAQLIEMVQRLQQEEEIAARRNQIREQQLEQERDRQIRQIQRNVDLDIQKLQNWYKIWAVVLPPIIPALVGIVVLFSRLLREREGIERSRLK